MQETPDRVDISLSKSRAGVLLTNKMSAVFFLVGLVIYRQRPPDITLGTITWDAVIVGHFIWPFFKTMKSDTDQTMNEATLQSPRFV